MINGKADLRRTVAEEQCLEHGFDFGETFCGQYHIGPLSLPCSERFVTNEISNWRISHCPLLHTCTIRDADGLKCGIILGHAVDNEGSYLTNTARLTAKAGAADFFPPRKTSSNGPLADL